MGLIEGGSLGWGIEGSGVVTAVGSEVTSLKVGDRIMTLTSDFLCSERVITPDRCVKIPNTLSFEAAATMPCVYATVIHCLLKVGRLQNDQTILIQSACGGVGLAAIQICQNVIGAKVCLVNSNAILLRLRILMKLDICDSQQRGEETLSHG
jgi:NADPH:quinone reductase-like Zn-dependent oxidoreductase